MTGRDRLKTAIAQTQRQIDAKIAAQREYSAKTDAQARLNGPELGFWEHFLGCRIDGSGVGNRVRVLYVFPALPGKGGGEREAVFELQVPDATGDEFEITWMRPRLDSGRVTEVVGRLNETKEFGVLLKGMRGLFGEEMKGQ